MIKTYKHICHGTCSQEVTVTYDTDTNKIVDLNVVGGCSGNLRGIRALVIGMDLQDVHDKLLNIKCGARDNSCPHQLALAVEEIQKSEH
jgi:uncharacterized protein (TIGR03905 family)